MAQREPVAVNVAAPPAPVVHNHITVEQPAAFDEQVEYHDDGRVKGFARKPPHSLDA